MALNESFTQSGKAARHSIHNRLSSLIVVSAACSAVSGLVLVDEVVVGWVVGGGRVVVVGVAVVVVGSVVVVVVTVVAGSVVVGTAVVGEVAEVIGVVGAVVSSPLEHPEVMIAARASAIAVIPGRRWAC